MSLSAVNVVVVVVAVVAIIEIVVAVSVVVGVVVIVVAVVVGISRHRKRKIKFVGGLEEGFHEIKRRKRDSSVSPSSSQLEARVLLKSAQFGASGLYLSLLSLVSLIRRLYGLM